MVVYDDFRVSFDSLSLKNHCFFVIETLSLKVIHSPIIIEALAKCLLVDILKVPLEFLITNYEALLFCTFELS